jgi:IS5 family transposase
LSSQHASKLAAVAAYVKERRLHAVERGGRARLVQEAPFRALLGAQRAQFSRESLTFCANAQMSWGEGCPIPVDGEATRAAAAERLIV